ncbi:MAG: 30S ribosomal protein S8 [Spirochaetes bacterium]|nr:30S ribosomal protein S8 [Spirochaetota bacterium]
MSISDPIANMLTMIRNAIHASKDSVDIPASNLKRSIAKILKEENYIGNYKIIRDNKQNIIRIFFKYRNKESVISGLKRVSTSGRRVYTGYIDLPRVMNGIGIAIVSTSKGVLTDAEARKLKIGGEVLCYIW